MAFAGETYALGFLAGSLSTLSPCVLPLLPIVVGSAINAHRYGALCLAAGLSLSFAIIGVFVAAFGFGVGLDGGVFRVVAAIVMGVFGIMLLSSRLQLRFGALLSGVEGRAGDALARFGASTSALGGMRGQFTVGLLLGAVWSPCTGPTIGAAALLAGQQKDLPQVVLTMALFGLGAAVPLLIVGTLSRQMLLRWRGRLLATGQQGRLAIGGLLVIVSALVLSGFDKSAEAAFVAHAPAWLLNVSGLV